MSDPWADRIKLNPSIPEDSDAKPLPPATRGSNDGPYRTDESASVVDISSSFKTRPLPENPPADWSATNPYK